MADIDLGDGFAFEIGEPKTLQGETEGGYRYPVHALMAGRTFERFRLDVNVVPNDPRPVETAIIDEHLLSFAGQPAFQVPVVPIAQQLAEKLHACVRSYAGQASSRPKDAFDTAALSGTVLLPSAGRLRDAVRVTFTLRQTAVPHAPPPLPADWDSRLEGFLQEHPLAGVFNAEALRARWMDLWSPVLGGSAADDAAWDIDTAAWRTV